MHSPTELVPIAKAICGDEQDTELFAQALKVAENVTLLETIRVYKTELLARLRDPFAVPMSRKDNSRELGTGRVLQAWLACREIGLRAPKLFEKYRAAMLAAVAEEYSTEMTAEQKQASLAAEEKYLKESEPGSLIPIGLRLVLQESKAVDQSIIEAAVDDVEEREEWEAMQAALPDLVRLERYERRAWSRYQRSIKQFVDVKLMQRKRDTAPRVD